METPTFVVRDPTPGRPYPVLFASNDEAEARAWLNDLARAYAPGIALTIQTDTGPKTLAGPALLAWARNEEE